jgi:hypothetical protein
MKKSYQAVILHFVTNFSENYVLNVAKYCMDVLVCVYMRI